MGTTCVGCHATHLSDDILSSCQLNHPTNESIYKPEFTGQARQGRPWRPGCYFGAVGTYFLFCYITAKGVSVSQILETVSLVYPDNKKQTTPLIFIYTASYQTRSWVYG